MHNIYQIITHYSNSKDCFLLIQTFWAICNARHIIQQNKKKLAKQGLFTWKIPFLISKYVVLSQNNKINLQIDKGKLQNENIFSFPIRCVGHYMHNFDSLIQKSFLSLFPTT